MNRLVGYVYLNRMRGVWRGLEFHGIAFGRRFFFGFVRFEHVSDRHRVS